jgi:hypothetical protein
LEGSVIVLKLIVGFFAVVGVAYVALTIGANLMFMNCTESEGAQAVSPSGEYLAVFEQWVCRNPTENLSDVTYWKRGTRRHVLLLEVRGTTEVGLNWNSDQELIVSYPRSAVVNSYPRSASVKRYEADFGLPRGTLGPTDPGS